MFSVVKLLPFKVSMIFSESGILMKTNSYNRKIHFDVLEHDWIISSEINSKTHAKLLKEKKNGFLKFKFRFSFCKQIMSGSLKRNNCT